MGGHLPKRQKATVAGVTRTAMARAVPIDRWKLVLLRPHQPERRTDWVRKRNHAEFHGFFRCFRCIEQDLPASGIPTTRAGTATRRSRGAPLFESRRPHDGSLRNTTESFVRFPRGSGRRAIVYRERRVSWWLPLAGLAKAGIHLPGLGESEHGADQTHGSECGRTASLD